MSNDLTSIDINAIEQLYFNCFSGRKESSYKRLVLYVAFKTISAAQRITQSKLGWYANTQYCIPEEDLNVAVAALVNMSMFGAISKYVVPAKGDRASTSNLSVKKDNTDVIDAWLSHALEQHPELSRFVAPKL
jgi:hypothetical protein